MIGIDVAKLTDEEREWICRLESVDYGQNGVLKAVESMDDLRQVITQLKEFDVMYPGGLLGYLKKARNLLRNIQSCKSGMEDYQVTVPLCERFSPGTPEFDDAEELGLSLIDKVVFVLVAGGLGERLGCSGPKLTLAVEMVTGITYIEFYCQLVMAWEDYWLAQTGVRCRIPLCIMTSDDTHHKTLSILQTHSFFGLQETQVHMLKQEKVPAFIDNNANLSLVRVDGVLRIETKPHGHGDIHRLLSKSGLPSKWLNEGKQFLIFFQDTNALMFYSLPPLLGTTHRHGFTMNSLVIPRKPGEAIGAVCCLTPKQECTQHRKPLTVNVEYNRLEMVLKTSDVNLDHPDPVTGYSKFPGNTNVIIFDLLRYASILHKSQGVVREFVNPKYDNGTTTSFQLSSRLECLMQDFPYLLEPNDKVGVTEMDRWMCFTTVKNNLRIAAQRCSDGLPPECALSAEADYYTANCRYLQLAVQCNGFTTNISPPSPVVVHRVTYPLGPKVVIFPSFAFSLHHFKKRIRGSITLYPNSTLVLDGNVLVEEIVVDGAVILRCTSKKSPLIVRGLTVKNQGYALVCTPENDDSLPPEVKMRGYVFNKLSATEIYL